MEQEDIIQNEIILWFRQKYMYKGAEPFGVIFHVPNGGKRSAFDGDLMKRQGALAGVTDLIVVSKTGATYIEVKTSKGFLSAPQKMFKEMLEYAGQGDKWYLVRSLEEFKKIMPEIGL